jgi:putative glycosyltransferase (TIGR04372 family)
MKFKFISYRKIRQKYIFFFLYILLKSLITYIQNYSKFLKNYYKFRFLYNKKFKNKLIALVPDQVIGPFCHFSEYFIRFCRVNNFDLKNDVIFVLNNKSVNNQLKLMLSRNVNCLHDSEVHNLIENGGNNFLRKYSLQINDSVPEDIKNGMNFFADCNVNFTFTQKEILKGYSILKKLGINEQDNFVCIHNKDNFYWSSCRNQNKVWDAYRDSKFEDLSSLIRHLNKKGLKVIRAGHYKDDSKDCISTMSLPANEKEFIDLFIQNFCYLSICGDSGIALIPWLFKKPILYHNFIPMGESPIAEIGVILPKKIINKDTRKILGVSELLNIKTPLIWYERGKIKFSKRNATEFQDAYLYDINNLEIVDNTSEEILIAYDELEKYFFKSKKMSQKDFFLQKKFKSLFPLHHPMRHTSCIISPSFLKNNRGILH